MKIALSPTENPGSAHVYLLFIFFGKFNKVHKKIQILKKSINLELAVIKEYHFLSLLNENKIKRTTGAKVNGQCGVALILKI